MCVTINENSDNGEVGAEGSCVRVDIYEYVTSSTIIDGCVHRE